MTQSPAGDPDTSASSDSLWRRLIGALRFLTILRLPASVAANDPPLATSLAFFPLVGLTIGVVLVLVEALAGWFWGQGVRAIAVVVAWGVITGGLHLDGLSDTFDGVMSWRPRERKLEIMRDSRVGVMGVLALAAILGLKVALLSGADGWAQALLVAPVLGRWAICYGLGRFPAARADGLGAAVQAQTSSGLVLAPTIIAALVALLLGGPRGAVALALVWLTVRWLARWWTRDLGGLTGDTYGALCEIAEVVALAALTARIA